jgi:hypothetical protein
LCCYGERFGDLVFFLLIFGLFDEVGDTDEDEVAVFIYGIWFFGLKFYEAEEQEREEDEE